MGVGPGQLADNFGDRRAAAKPCQCGTLKTRGRQRGWFERRVITEKRIRLGGHGDTCTKCGGTS